MKLIDLNFHVHQEFGSLAEAVHRHWEALGYVDFIKDRAEVEVIKHTGREENMVADGVKYLSFKAQRGFFNIPFKTLSYVKKQKPDAIIVQGLIFPVQVLLLRFFVKRNCLIIVQYHKEGPYRRKRVFQKIADRCIDAYIFTALGNAKEWLDKRIIGKKEKCYELPEASTWFSKKNKDESRSKLGINGDRIFLHVGRLTSNKDPLTVLLGYEQFVAAGNTAQLYMIYHTEELTDKVREKISGNPLLQHTVHLVGKVAHEQLMDWFSAADFYISGSHHEGSSYALIESMACGCIPVLTDIPSFRKLTGEGQFAFLFTPGDPVALCNRLKELEHIDRDRFSEEVITHFHEELSFKAIADGLYKIVAALVAK